MWETIALILCGVIFVVVMACFKMLAIAIANEHPHKCKKCGGIMKVKDFYVFPESHGHHGIVWYECSQCGHKEELDF